MRADLNEQIKIKIPESQNKNWKLTGPNGGGGILFYLSDFKFILIFGNCSFLLAYKDRP